MPTNWQSDASPERALPPEAQVREELERILNSNEYKSTPRRRKMLRYLIEELLAGRDKSLKGYTIATVVFGRDHSFDPQSDPVVRLEARRLRHDLDGYYVAAGRNNPLRITIPKGQYAPVIELIDDNIAGPEDIPEPAHAMPPPVRPPLANRRRWQRSPAVAVGAIVVGVAAVAEVESGDVHSGFDECLDLVVRVGGGAQGADDLCSAHVSTLGLTGG